MHKPTTIYRNNGETFNHTYFIDARDAVERCPDEWSFTPFSQDVIKATLRREAESIADSVDVPGKSAIDLHNARLLGIDSVNGTSIT